jgi:excisionase family DNA binding protein
MTTPELISFREAASLIGVSERTLTRMSERGELTVYWFGSTKRLSVQDLLTPKLKSAISEPSSLTERP